MSDNIITDMQKLFKFLKSGKKKHKKSSRYKKSKSWLSTQIYK